MFMQIYIAKRILLTLAYTEQFTFPLNQKELYSRLLVSSFVDLKSFINALNYLKRKNLINYFKGYFFVSGLSLKHMNNLAETRKSRAKFAQKKWQELNKFINFAKYIPFITGIAITGSLAVNNTIKDDDIDFMIVTTPNRLWLTRLIVTFYASIKGKRRSFSNEESNSWCFNLWVEETDLQLPANSRSVYESYEVIQAVWVVSKNGVASKFRKLNNWTKRSVYFNKYDFKNIENGKDWSSKTLLLSNFLFLLNLTSFYFQYLYMKPHMTIEKVSKSHAFFHPRDTKFNVFNNWKKTLLRLV